ncbi:hypothetical protein [Paraburkholderia sp. GAS448]|uniref:hypothetical protein n=1 Tax=Paraburkholderia sp. GAS448 TaxID=3035136 RepID=UPI003D1B30EE
MKTLQYQGFVPGYYAQCRYTFRFANETPTLVLMQDPDANLFLDNSIEAIVTELLRTELLDVDATQLRVFRMDSSRGWSEVRFDTVARRKVKLTWFQSLKVVFGYSDTQPFEVSDPSWEPVTPEQRAFLESLDHPALAGTPTSPHYL